jgi:Mn2+/Fe2+ NRAMP family transporter
VMAGGNLLPDNPAASVFKIAAGDAGYRIFGVVLWCAAITSVVGSAYTSISFLRTFHPKLDANHRLITTAFILVSSVFFIFAGKPPVTLLVAAGTLNGFILPLALGLLLIAVTKKRITGNYRHPLWLSIIGWIVVAAMAVMAVKVLSDAVG